MFTSKKCRYGFMIYNTKDVWQGRSFQEYGEYGEAEVSVFQRLIKKGQYVIDVGASFGSFTVPFRRIVGKDGLVIAFEPERLSYHALCGTVALNNFDNVLCFQQAAGRKPGYITVPVLDEDLVGNFGGTDLTQDHSAGRNYQVPIIRLDDALAELPYHFLKVDVEGMEIDVILGAANIIYKNRPVLYVDDYANKTYSENLRNLIKHFGYKVYTHITPLFNPNNYYEEKRNFFILPDGSKAASINLLCLPDEMENPFTLDELEAMAGRPRPEISFEP